MGLIDLIFSLLFTRNIYRFLGFDFVAFGSIFVLLWIVIKEKNTILKFNKYVLCLLISLFIFGFLGFNSLTNLISLSYSEAIFRNIFSTLTFITSILAAYKFFFGKKINTEIKYAPVILVITLIIYLIQLILPLSLNDGVNKFALLSVYKFPEFSLKGFSNEPGIFCALIIFLLIIEEKFNKINLKKRIFYIFLSLMTSSTTFFIIPFFYFYKLFIRVNISFSKKILFLILPVVVLFIVLRFNLILFNNKFELLISGGGVSDYGGRYLANYLIIQNILSPESLNQFLFGSGIGSFHSILEKYLISINLPSQFIETRPYDYGGSELLLIINDLGVVGFSFLTILLFYLSKNISKINLMDSYRKLNKKPYRLAILLLSIKGFGLYSPFLMFLSLISIL